MSGYRARTDPSIAALSDAAPDLLAACKDALVSTIGGLRECGFCAAPADSGEMGHTASCWVPEMLSAVKRAEGG